MVVDLAPLFASSIEIFNAQNWPFINLDVLPQYVHVGVEANFNKWDQKVEYEPNVHHFDVGCFWQVVADVDKHRSQHQHC